MSKQPLVQACFECRFEVGTTKICLSRKGMPEQTFEARLEYMLPDVSESPRFACGFTVFMERGEPLDQSINRLLGKLRNVSPASLEEADYERLKNVASAWILFNFRPALEKPAVPRRVNDLVKLNGGRIVALLLAMQELTMGIPCGDSISVPFNYLPMV